MSHTVEKIEGLPGPVGTVPFNESTYAANLNFLSWGGRAKGGWIVEVSVNIGSVADEGNVQEVISVPGVSPGDYVELALNNDWQRLHWFAYVNVPDSVKIVVTNLTGSALNPPEDRKATLRITDLT